MKAIATRAGFLTSVQDAGRFGYRRFGVSPGGALDPFALRLANLLVGNDQTAAGLETTSGGLRLLFHDERVVSWCGADSAVRIGALQIPAGHAAFAGAMDELVIDPPRAGLRTWLAISGGIDVPLIMGSRSTDLRGHFGGLSGGPIHDGDEVPLSANSARSSTLLTAIRSERIASWKPADEWTRPAQTNAVLRFTTGAEWTRFSESSREAFAAGAFSVSADSDRMGVRLKGPALAREDLVDLLSEPVAPGTVQVPSSGDPILLLGDCQTIGGYPKIAQVITVDLAIAAQLRPNDTVAFREVSLAEAHQLLLEREADLEKFRCGLDPHFS